MKYDFSLDMETDNSLSLILRNVKEKTTILEFGPANGRMTRYLKTQLDCKVYLAELEEAAGKQALEYGEALVVGDIENYEWKEQYKDISFDYIIFADVLEHLRNPLKVLIEAKELLKDEGSILLSVPNLAHNSVLIDLLNNKFQYHSTGLLDDTHIHFFTITSLEQMIEDAGLHIAKKMATYAPVGTIEIQNSTKDTKGISAGYWNTRQYGELYQYVYEIKNSPVSQTELVDTIKDGLEHYYLQVYYCSKYDWNEQDSQKYFLKDFKEEKELVIDLKEAANNIRIDPINTNCIIDILEVYGMNGTQRCDAEICQNNAELAIDNTYRFTDFDPWMIIQFEEKVESIYLKIRFRTIDFELPLESMESMKILWHALEEKENEIEMKSEEILHLQEKNNECQQHIVELNTDYQNQIVELNASYQKQLTELTTQYQNEKLRADGLQEQRNQLESRRIYKIYRFFKRK